MAATNKHEAVDIRELLNAFKILGGDKHGCINFQKLTSLLISKGRMTQQEIKELLIDENCYKGDVLDFINLCVSILTTKAVFDHAASDDSNTFHSNKKVNSRTFTRKKGSSRPATAVDGRKLPKDAESQHLHAINFRGCFFNTLPSAGMFGNRYLLEIDDYCPVEIIAKATDATGKCKPKDVVEVLVFLENDEPTKTLVTFSTFKNSEGYCVVKTNLKKGKYLVVPVISNWDINISEGDMEIPPLATVNEDGEVTLTAACKNALRAVFDCVDLDRNGLISQTEFDFFIQHISGETAADEWPTVEDNFDTENGQLTFEGFLTLYQMAVETDPQDVINMLQKMGMNNSLFMEKALPFLLTVSTEVTKPVLSPLPVTLFDTLMEKVFRKTAIEQGQCTKVRNMNDLSLYIHKLPHRVTIVIQNQSHSKVAVRLDCSKSENCISHRKTLDYTFEVAPRTCIVGHHLFPDNLEEAWSVDCIDSLITETK